MLNDRSLMDTLLLCDKLLKAERDSDRLADCDWLTSCEKLMERLWLLNAEADSFWLADCERLLLTDCDCEPLLLAERESENDIETDIDAGFSVGGP